MMRKVALFVIFIRSFLIQKPAEAVLQDVMLHNLVVAVSVYADIRIFI